MKCFVIMPFEERFDDVYAQIKLAVETCLDQRKARCFRLDESRPSGRITERLLKELKEATLCIADVTGNRPNVMWEVGYAMALHKPTILLTQDVDSLPFDIRDMQSVSYDRDHLTQSLVPELTRVVLDTIKHVEAADPSSELGQHAHIGRLAEEIERLRSIVASAIELLPKNTNAPVLADANANTRGELPPLEGHWILEDSQSHLYAQVIHGQMIAPYCYGGNDHVTAAFFDWRRANEYWFARFAWLQNEITGFSFLKQDESMDFIGAWWSDGSAGADIARSLGRPPEHSGEPMHWVRAKKQETPTWAERFFEDVERDGLLKTLATAPRGVRARRLFGGPT